MKDFQPVSFSFDDVRIRPSEQIGPHSQTTWELSAVLTGRGVRTVGNESAPFSEGDVVLVPPAMRHVWEFRSDTADSDGKVRNLSVAFSSDFLKSVRSLFPETAPDVDALLQLCSAVVYPPGVAEKLVEFMLSLSDKQGSVRVASFFRLLPIMADVEKCCTTGSVEALSPIERRLKDIEIY